MLGWWMARMLAGVVLVALAFASDRAVPVAGVVLCMAALVWWEAARLHRRRGGR
jgi:hypothetical protein